MKKRRKFKRNKNTQTKKMIINNQKTVLLVIYYIIGLFIGAVSVKKANPQLSINIKELAENYISLKTSGSLLNIFANSAITDLAFILLSLVFGLCLIGEIVLWIIPAVRGMGMGLLIGYIYINHGLDSLPFIIFVISVPASICVCATVISCKEGLLTINDLKKAVFTTKEAKDKKYYKMYFLRNLILLIIMMLADGIGSTFPFVSIFAFPN